MSSLKVSRHRDVTCAMARVKLFGSQLNVYVYLVDGMLVDTGPSRFAAAYNEFFRSQSIDLAVLTHHHEDHSGNAPGLEKLGVPIYIKGSAVDICRRRAVLPVYRRFFWGRREKFAPLPLPDTLETRAGKWQIIDTPGHTGDHVAFLNPATGAVFTGDLIVTPKTKLVLRTENIAQTIDSLRTLLRYDPGTVYCSHAGAVDNGRGFVQAKLDYLENLRGEILELHGRGLGERAITKKLFPKTAALYYISGGEWAAGHIVRSVLEDHGWREKATK